MSVPPTRWLARLLGRRGASLAVLGVAFLFVGVGTLAAEQAPPAHFLLYNLIPTPVSAGLWGLAGLLALWAATKRGTGRDGFGFAALVVPLGLRAFSYVWASVAYLVGAGDWPFAWTAALVWLGLLALVLIIAGWPEAPRTTPRKRGTHD